MTPRSGGLASRLMVAQVVVIAAGGVTLLLALSLVAPPLFSEHLRRTGEDSPAVVHHAEQAFQSSFAIALGLAMVAALAAAGLVSWFLVRRVAHPVVQLAAAADAVAAGDFDVQAPTATFGTELTRLSDAFERMAHRLATAEATRTSMLADLAHELRTPLATLEAYVDGLEDDVLPADATTYSVMRDQVTRLRRLAADLKDAAAAQEHALGLVLVPVELGVVVHDVVAGAGPGFLGKGVALSLDAAGRGTVVDGDAVRLQQVLANLLDNALRHTAPGGHVSVVVSTSDGLATVAVADDGEGIAAEQLGHVFDRFYRADPARTVKNGGGSGLGLTIAQAIAEDHGGTLAATSEGLGRGSTFTLQLPLAAGASGRRGT